MKLKNSLSIKGKYRIITYRAGTREVLRQSDEIHNLIVLNANNGLYLVLERLLGITTYDLEVTQAKIGTGNTAPDASDTDLETVVLDGILVAQRSRVDDDEIMITFFISDADLADGTYKEFGIFCTDQLFARSLITPNYTKASGEDTQIEYTLTISAA